MKRWTILIVVMLFGGMGGYWLVDTVMRRSAANAAIELFETYCVPFWTGKLIVPNEGFQRIDNLSWQHERSRMGVEFTPFACMISDMFSTIGTQNHGHLRRAVAGVVSEHMPEFGSTPPEITLEETERTIWARGEGDDRMAVSLFWEETEKMVLFAARIQSPQFLQQLKSTEGFLGLWGMGSSKK